MTVIGLKKTIVKDDGGVYTDAHHKVTYAEVRALGETITLNIRLTTYKDQATADADGLPASFKMFDIPISDPAVAAAFDSLKNAIYSSIKTQDSSLADAEDVEL